jgi:hypothetical protein
LCWCLWKKKEWISGSDCVDQTVLYFDCVVSGGGEMMDLEESRVFVFCVCVCVLFYDYMVVFLFVDIKRKKKTEKK